MDKAVIIPALNPDGKLKEIVRRNLELENLVILIDDGSDEAHRQIFWELSEACIVLRHEENKGKGEAIKTALRYIKEEQRQCGVIGIMDADGQHLPDDMEKLLWKARSHPRALVLGCRTIDGKVPWKSRAGNRITRGVFHLLTGVSLSDTQTGLRAFSAEMLDFMLEIQGSRYEYEMGVLTAAYNYGMNCRFVFHERRTLRTAADYLLLAAMILILNSLVLESFLVFFQIPVYPAKILTELVLFLFSWLVQKKWIFQRKQEKAVNLAGREGKRV